MPRQPAQSPVRYPEPWDVDDNRAVMDIIRGAGGPVMIMKKRMAEGAIKYGHGMRVADDTRQYNSEKDSWLEHALQENLDGVVYLACAMERLRRRGQPDDHLRGILLHQIAICDTLRDLVNKE